MSLIHGTVNVNTLPAAISDGANAVARFDRYGAQMTRSEYLAWLEEGSYFIANNPAVGTGVAMGIQTSFSATANVLFVMRNGSATKRIIPHFIRLINTATGASTTSSNMAIVIDTANRWTTGGTDLLSNVVNANSGNSATSAVDVLRYSTAAAAAVAPRTIARLPLKVSAAPNWTIGDEVLITFGDPGFTGQAQLRTPTGAAVATTYTHNVPAVMLNGQNHCMTVHMWNVANATTAPSWEFQLGWWER